MIHSSLFRRSALTLTLTLALALAVPAQAAHHTKYLPNDTVIYFTVNLKQALESKLIPKDAIAKAKDWLKGQEEVQKYLTLLGVDPFTDFESLTFASTSITEQEKGLAIIHGKFDVEKFQKTAEKVAKENEDVLKIKKIGDYKVWEISVPNAPTSALAVIVDKTTIIVTPDEELLKEALAKAGGKKTTELKKEVAAYLKKAKKTSLSFMVLGSVLSKAPIPGAQAEQAKLILDKLDLISGSVNVTDDIKIHLSVTAKDVETAALIGFGLKAGLIQAPKLIDGYADQFEKLAPFKDLIKAFIKTIKVNTKEMVVSTTATITKEMLDTLMKELKTAKDD
jgi:hypothetical protein